MEKLKQHPILLDILIGLNTILLIVFFDLTLSLNNRVTYGYIVENRRSQTQPERVERVTNLNRFYIGGKYLILIK